MPRVASAATSSGRSSGGSRASWADVPGMTWSSVISPGKSLGMNAGELDITRQGRYTNIRSESSEQELVERVAEYQPGSAADFERLYRNSYRRILGTLVTMLRDRPPPLPRLQQPRDSDLAGRARADSRLSPGCSPRPAAAAAGRHTCRAKEKWVIGA